MKLSEMRQILAGSNIRLSKSLGQNFLHDGNQLRRIVAAAHLTRSDRVLEVGPGLGPLTEILLAQAGEIFVIEKDRRFFEFLGKRFASALNLALQHDDALKLLQREPRDWSDWKMVSNLPYSVASPILVELAQASGCPERMVVTVQREVAQRTACVTLLRRPKPLLSPDLSESFTKIVKRGFSQRRKMMFKLLREDWPPGRLTMAWEYLQLPLTTRAEQVSLEEFVKLTKLLAAG